MAREVPVTVFWEGRARLMGCDRYSTLSRFPENGDSWSGGSWSIVLEFDTPPAAQGNPSSARAHFLVEDAPHDWLYPGNSFEMLAGHHKVATVRVLNGGS